MTYITTNPQWYVYGTGTFTLNTGQNVLDFQSSLIGIYNSFQNIASCALHINVQVSIACIQRENYPEVIVYYGGNSLSINKSAFKVFRIGAV